VASYLDRGVTVFDVSTRDAPEPVGHVDVFARGVDGLEVDDTTLALAAAGHDGVHVLDVTDPSDPRLVDTLIEGTDSHNVAVVPDANLAYNSRNGHPGIDVLDLSNPENPRLATVWQSGGVSCHDVTVDAGADRAYCAGRSATYVLDITRPLNPRVVAEVDDPEIDFHHWALATPDQETLIVGDEVLGDGRFEQRDGCGNAHNTPVASLNGDNGALWFFEKVPEGEYRLNHTVSVEDEYDGWCTAHFGDFVPGTGLLAVGWYNAGVVLVDWAGHDPPNVVDRWHTDGVDVWDVRHHDGRLYTGDLTRGMDVLDVSVDESLTARAPDTVPTEFAG
jgi:hypothetical protein